ncbi:UDP-glycosyltransferase 83A1-like [Cucumis sativus]|uniref:UDP-glycosyltransferase 83A1-like n=1 Tax=Cucumis sativus TaxID=3659 RepID=UPI0012F510A2|nr:UDP-glycosyltransferase 83A1-like [Cucumis sativus]
MGALAETNHIGDANIHLVSITNGMEPGANRNDRGKLHDTMLDTVLMKLEELINTIHRLGGEEITSVIADESLGWALEVAVKTRIRRVGFSPASAAMLAKLFSIPKLIQEKLIELDGQININSVLIKLMNLTNLLFIQNHMPNSMLY